MYKRTAIFIGVALLMISMAPLEGQNSFSSAPPAKRMPKIINVQYASKQSRIDQFWARAQEEVYRSAGEIKAQDDREKRKGFYYAKLIRGNPSQKRIALTFDDGPHPKYTRELLAILKKYNVKATFFVVGMMAERNPDLVRLELKEGHLIGNHTYHHVNLTRIPDSEIPVEWQACTDVLKSILGRSIGFARPPGGDYDSIVIKAAMSRGLTTVLWTDDPGDYASPGDKVIATRVLDRVSNGGIILLHDGIQQTVDVLPQIIQTLKKKGFKFVTVDKMISEAKEVRAK